MGCFHHRGGPLYTSAVSRADAGTLRRHLPLSVGRTPTASGTQPLRPPPAALTPTRDSLVELQKLINHAQLTTIYPPVAQLIFALAGGSLVGLKGIFILFDLGNCVLLLLLLYHLRRHPAWLCVYAWHPLAVLESSASGHVDVAAIFFILLAIYFTLTPVTYGSGRNSGLKAGAALGLAIMTKIFPIIFAPLVFIQLPKPSRAVFLITLCTVCVGVCIPFWPELDNGIHTLKLYVQHWEFSGFAFRILRQWTESGQHARIVVASAFCLIFVCQWLKLFRHREMARVNLKDTHVFVHVSAYIMLAFLLLTPTLHPWYALYLVVLLPLGSSFTSFPAGTTLGWTVLLSYQVAATRAMSGIWYESTLLSFYVFAGPVSALCITLVLARRRNRC